MSSRLTGRESSSPSDLSHPRLSAIVVAFGKERLLEECLAKLRHALARVEGGTELIVIVNALVPELVRRLRNDEAFMLVEGSGDLGFAGAVDAGLAVARGHWIALVNDDCLVAEDALAELLRVGDVESRIGSVAASVCFANSGLVNSAGLEVDALGVARDCRLGDQADGGAPEPTEVFGASATLALYRRQMLDELGGFDASFFAYLEDADLAWRARAAGWRCVLAPRAIGFHRHSSSLTHGAPAKHFLVGRNRVRMLAKNATPLQLVQLPRIVFYDLLYVAYVAATSRSAAPLRGRLRGIAEWRAYRSAGRDARAGARLAAPFGLREALRRNRLYVSEAIATRDPPDII